MKLYFYKTNAVSGITVEVCDAIEKPKTYCKEIGVFPTYLNRVRKDDIGNEQICKVLERGPSGLPGFFDAGWLRYRQQ